MRRFRRLRGDELERRDAPAASYILTNDHADVQVKYTAPNWNMYIKDFDTLVNWPALAPLPVVSSLEFVNPAYSQQTRPAGSTWDFVGVGAGQPFYLIPQNQNPLLLYSGFGSDDGAGTYDAYDATAESHGRAVGVGHWVKFQLVSVIGPGSISAWANGDTGPIRFFSSYNDGVSNPDPDGIDYTDGISVDDGVWAFQSAHIHLNFGFTAIGRYEVKFQPIAQTNGSLNVGPPFTFVYSVGNVGLFGFQASNYTVNEAAGNASITLTRTGGTDGAVSVDYATAGGTATPNVDYTPANGTVTFDDQEMTKTITVPIIDDNIPEPNETIGLTLSNFRPWQQAGGGPEDPPLQGAISNATLTIVDNDSAPPPQVATVVVNGGAVQRSRVTTLKATFDQHVSFASGAANAFQLTHQGDNAPVNLAANVDDSGSGTAVTLTFTGGAVNSGSLADGRFTLAVLANQVSGTGGALDGNGDGTGGDNYTLVGTPGNGLFRLFGDADGNGTVDVLDFGAFRQAFGSNSAIFDYDGGGSVDVLDFGQFRQRFGSSV